MVTQRRRLLAAACVALVLWTSAPSILAQPAAAPAPAAAPGAGTATREEQLAQLWENLLHFIRMAQHQAAKSHGQALLDFKAKPEEIYRLSVATPGSLAVLSRGRRLEGMKDITSQLLKIIDQGYRAVRSDPDQIKKAIELLGGTTRQYLRGRDRIIVSGEYAVPLLLRTLDDPKTTMALRERIRVVLPKIGKEAVLPLSVSLQTTNPQLRQIIANTLGMIEYSHAVPRLKELYDRKDLQPQTRRIVKAALAACSGADPRAVEKPTAQLYYDLALRFYYRAESLKPDARGDLANVWYWDTERGGLLFKPVPREIFCDIYAMRMARLALGHDAKFYPAVSLWLAAGLKREADLPAGETDPTREATDPPARFYVLAAGAKYQQDILARALRDRDWPVAVGAIEALGKTAGAQSLVQPVAGGAQPLVEALTSSNRVVRYWAAISLATALPKNRFNGHELVMPVLNEAIRQTGKKTALIIAAEQERRNVLKDAARAGGYEVIDEADHARGLAAARAGAGVDVVILANDPDAMIGVTMIRRDPLLVTLPVVIAAQTQRFQDLARSDPRVRLVGPTAKAEEVTEGITECVKASAGVPLTAKEATDWAIRAAQAVRTLGRTGTAVYNISRCRSTLVAALADPRAEVKTAAVGALATMPGPQAQRAIAKLATDAAADAKIRVVAFDALGESVRRFGNSLTDKQAETIVAIVNTGAEPIRTSAAQILGALDLPSEKVKGLILKTPADK